MIQPTDFVASLKELLQEAFNGPPSGQGSWFSDYRADAGLRAMLDSIDAQTASRVMPGCTNTIAAHASHLRFSLDLFIRALGGENSYETADWKQSWKTQTVNDDDWTNLRADLRRQSQQLLRKLDASQDWADRYVRTGSMARAAATLHVSAAAVSASLRSI